MSGNFHWQTTECFIQQRFYQQQYGRDFVATKAMNANWCLVSFSLGRIPNALGVSIPMKATFFMTYIMIDGWTSNAAEIFRLLPLLIYHLQNSRVQTDKERVKVIPATPPQYNIVLSRVSLYFLLGLVYAIISPLILPFLCVYFALGYIVYRNQVWYLPLPLICKVCRY